MSNELYPIFLKVNQLQVLIIGGGEVGLEKLSFMLKNSPSAQVTLISKAIDPRIEALAKSYRQVKLIEKAYHPSDLEGNHLVIAATDSYPLHEEIRALAREKGILVNVADTPELCDFYLGGIVTRGNLKVAISTNGKSPTFAKRFRQTLEEVLPIETDALLLNLRIIRDRLKGDFAVKVRELNDLTSSLVQKSSISKSSS